MIITQMLQERVARQPAHIAFRFLRDGAAEGQTLTLQELETKARSIAAAIQEISAPGDSALLLYPPGVDFVAAFFGCLYAGIIAVPAPVPRFNRSLDQFRALLADAQPQVILTTAELKNLLGKRAGEIRELAPVNSLATDERFEADPASGQEIRPSAQELAYIQYTSGSTTAPRGVMISHHNLAHNIEFIQCLCQFSEETPMVSWLPHYHDMGLNALLMPLYGCPLTFMPPASFIQRPLRWLQAITQVRATHTVAPNFAYDLCARAISPEQRATLDLSCWRIALNGAESVRADTLNRFATTFAQCGFRREAFVPVYGLAEACLFVSGSKAPALSARTMRLRKSGLQENRVAEANAGEPDGATLVSCGRVARGLQVRIVDPQSRQICSPDRIGEIWASGESVARGYWNHPKDTAQTFHAHLADRGEGPFLRTGDLGFIKDEELFITGRLKDLLIIRGRNHYPQDLEKAIEGCHAALRTDAAAAFAIDIEGEERVVLVAELKRRVKKTDIPAVIDAVRRAITEAHELDLYAVRLLHWGTLPITTSGKIQRSACRAAFLAGTLDIVGEWTRPRRQVILMAPPNEIDEQSAQDADSIAAWMISKIAAETGTPPADVDVRRSFASLGLDSLSAVRLTGELEQWLGKSVSPTLVYDHTNIAALAAYLDRSGHLLTRPCDVKTTRAERNPSISPIAIIGIGCRFPGANGPDAYWQMLRAGVDAISEVPAQRWKADQFFDPRPMTPGKMNTRWGGFLEHIDLFDPAFFNISPREATSMDPQQRLLLEVAWEALEDAGQTRGDLAVTPVGVFIGISTSEYGALQIAAPERIDAYWSTGNALSIAANRLSYFFNFRGPSIAIDTACSSSLVAVHLACQSLRQGESTVALAGGVNLMLTPTITVNFSMGGGTSPDGSCKPFDAGANGIVRGEGAGVVVLKPLERALAEGDPIYAVILGSAINQDGSTNGIVAPNREAQQACLRSALRHAGVPPEQIQYVEAHGTGTFLGDPIEAMALGDVLGRGRRDGQTCAIGSVKSNIGHLEAAAGVASLIKVALALKHRELPPTLHFQKPNPHIPFEQLRLRVVQSLAQWPEADQPPTAGVSSFGFGGTNAHVVLQAAPSGRATASRPEPIAAILPFSAHNEDALRALARNYVETIERAPACSSLGDLCYTAAVRRTHHDYRAAVVFSKREDLLTRLRSFAAGTDKRAVLTGKHSAWPAPRVAFVFSGHGSQWWGMGRELMAHEPVFRETIASCDELLRPYAGWSLLQEMEVDEFRCRIGAGAKNNHASLEVSQVALFAIQVGLAEIWRNWGVHPAAVVGHSMGEVAAAHAAGALTLSDALRVIFYRSHLMQKRLDASPASGAMALVRISRSEAEEALACYSDRLALAAHNAPQVTMLSGEETALQQLLQSLKHRGIASRLARAPGAGHCPQMEPLRSQLVALLDGESAESLQPQPSAIPIFSTVTGRKEPGEVFGASYWGRNIREPVLFAEAITEMIAARINYFIEVAPNPLLVSSIQQCLREAGSDGKALASVRSDHPELLGMLETVGNLYVDGYPLDWRRFHAAGGTCVSLPSYPLQRDRFWLPRTTFASNSEAPPPTDDIPQIDDWIYHLGWQADPDGCTHPAARIEEPQSWLLFIEKEVGRGLRESLQQAGAICWTVLPGKEFRRLQPTEWEIDPTKPEHFQRLLDETDAGGTVRAIVHAWSLNAPAARENTLSFLEAAQDLGCVSVLHLIQALAQTNQPSRLWLITAGSQAIEGDSETVSFSQTPLWGMGRVILFEHPELRCRMVDLSATNTVAEVPALVRELQRSNSEDHVALRGGLRYRGRLVRGLPPPPAASSTAESKPKFLPQASYLITGGLGGLGLTVATWMVENGARHLALMGRRPPPAETKAIIAGLEEKGAKVVMVSADVTCADEVDRVLKEIRKAMPPLRGIVHAAAHLDDGLLRQLSRERFRSVMAPKVEGAWILHTLTRHQELDFFVMFSSAASLIGSPGQANYAAANAFLDGLAHYRAGMGAPALSINWGPWSGVGGAARIDRGGQLTHLGFGSIAPEQGVKVLGRLLDQKHPQVGVMPVSWRRVRKAYPRAAHWPLLAGLWQPNGEPLSWMPDDEEGRNDPSPSFRRESPAAPDFVAPSTPLEKELAAIWSEVLGVKRVGVNENFLQLGGDSLMAVQMLSKISTITSGEISGQLLISNPTVALLAKALERVPSTGSSVAKVAAIEPNTIVQIEHRPLLSLFAIGKIAPVKGAALCYLAKSYLDRAGLRGEEVANDWCHNLPGYVARLQTFLGPIALILLPLPESHLYHSQEALVKSMVEGLEMAKQVGARSASLMGLLPSASDYGRAVTAAIAARKDLPLITTGHATTAAAVVLNLVGILHKAGRDLSGEQVAFLGLGSVGMATLRLMLKCLSQPSSLLLCDVYAKRDLLEQIRREVIGVWGDATRVRVVESGEQLPDELYQASLIIGATNVPAIVDIGRVQPGTILVDDSAPHCFAPEPAIRRFEKSHDILFTEGGMMRSPQPMQYLFYVPPRAQAALQSRFFSSVNSFNIPGCILSSLLSFDLPELQPTVGLVNTDNSVRHYETLRKLGFQAADLHCEDYVLAADAISRFRHRFGR